MAQRKVTKEHGTHFFEKTWANSTGAHIGLLEGGGYLHYSGLPIGHKSELTEVIPIGPERNAAEKWWENRGKEEEGIPKKKNIFLDLENVLRFEGGEDVKSVSDIINNTISGPVQEAFLKVFHQKQELADKAKLREESRIGMATKKLKAEALAKDAVD